MAISWQQKELPEIHWGHNDQISYLLSKFQAFRMAFWRLKCCSPKFSATHQVSDFSWTLHQCTAVHCYSTPVVPLLVRNSELGSNRNRTKLNHLHNSGPCESTEWFALLDCAAKFWTVLFFGKVTKVLQYICGRARAVWSVCRCVFLRHFKFAAARPASYEVKF